jgi:hypothetical protein
MLFPVQLQQVDGRYRAVLPGMPPVVGVGNSSTEAVIALRAEVAAQISRGEIIWVNIPALGEPTGRVFTEEDREAAEEMIAEIYRERDAQKAAEFPE